jgi:hypothetical protein
MNTDNNDIQYRPNGSTHNKVMVLTASGKKAWKWELKR